MKRILTIFSLAFLSIGTLALYLMPVFWRPEPVLAFRIGIGAGVFAVLFTLALLFQIILLAKEWGEKQATVIVAREHDESYRQFLRRLDHELKNPLTGLQAALTNLHESKTETDHQQAVENASLAVGRLGRILRDLRKLSELEYQMLEHRPVNVGLLVNEMVSAACAIPGLEGRVVSVLISQVPVLPHVTGDRDMLGLALYNLIDNALKFTVPEDGVEVRVREDGRSIFIEVADSGTGISPGEHSSIWEDLYRGRNAQEIEGSGLGLSLVRRIINLHGGEISLRSDPAQGRGTVFTIRLPVEKESKMSPNGDRGMTGL
jgi:two-component system OmpR family sensor kinase